MEEIIEGSVWVHLKTRGEYSVVTEAHEEATSARVVVYKSLNNGSKWVRPRIDFLARFEPLHGA